MRSMQVHSKLKRELLKNKSKSANIENLKAVYTNADQFLNKKDYIIQFIAGNEPNVIMISEVIPKAQVNPIEEQALDIAGCELYVNFKNSD